MKKEKLIKNLINDLTDLDERGVLTFRLPLVSGKHYNIKGLIHILKNDTSKQG